MSIKRMFESKYFLIAAIVCSVLLLMLVSFGAGVKVGLHKAFFSGRFGENYERNFLGGADDRGGRGMPSMKKIMDKAEDRGMRNAHGLAGEIVAVNDGTLIVKNRENQENTVSVSEATIINRGKDTLTLGDLMVGQHIVIVGKPQDTGVIAAHLIRVFQESNPQ